MASLVRAIAARAAAAPLVRRAGVAAARSACAPSVQLQTARSMSVFQNLKDTVSNKLEERNQAKARTSTCSFQSGG